jgi:hypothetical protein
LHRKKLLPVPAFQILEINAKTKRNEKVQQTPRHCPGIVAFEISIQLPQSKEEKEDRRAGDQNFVRGNQFHRHS